MQMYRLQTSVVHIFKVKGVRLLNKDLSTCETRYWRSVAWARCGRREASAAEAAATAGRHDDAPGDSTTCRLPNQTK